ncbi:Mcm2-7 hexameric complex component [Blyttiomyces sp. JEL0837]|nr:Mcm2-7 hexameric complex component [Blyttiomyces sp. JEL0837]
MATLAANNSRLHVNYPLEKEKIETFLNKFQAETTSEDALSQASSLSQSKKFKYKEQINAIADREQSQIVIELDDIASFEQSDDELVRNIENNTLRYVNLFSEVIDQIIPVNSSQPSDYSSPLDVFMWHRSQHARADGQDSAAFPKALLRRYTVFFKARSKQKAISIRDVKGTTVGRIVKVRGIVTRVSNVKPQAVVATLSCDRCGYENFQEVTSTSFNPMAECISEECKKNNQKGRLHLQTRASKFIKFQEAKLQELTDQVPMGHIPRTMTVHLCEDLTRQVSPGDSVIITGIFLPILYTGFKALRAGLITETYVHAQHIVPLKRQYSQMELTREIGDQIRQLTDTPDLYSHLAKSIAPEIYGHEDVKKALLLLLVGGTSKQTGDGMKIRGDLNVCLMGDPGVAKSQLLKYISKTAPRGVYTTGRGSSGVGLTASVMRDPVTEEMILEGGALVLADNGIACIDEFDKMDENDRTAIHEVMEQQTISISKAGITTTLNARTSILAAANPQFGRYNTRLRPTENINLPAALLSRFDLLFLILDKPDLNEDLRLASHVTYVHMHNRHQTRANEPNMIDANILRHYISVARTYSPKIKPETANFLVNAYVHLRQREEVSELQYTCARSLLSMIRLSTALARLRFSDDVEIGDVEEALRLIEVSKASVNDKESNRPEDANSQIYRIIRDMSREGDGSMALEIELADIRSRVTVKGFSDEDLLRCIETYETGNLWMRIRNGTALAWVNDEADD